MHARAIQTIVEMVEGKKKTETISLEMISNYCSCVLLNNAIFCVCPPPYTGTTCQQLLPGYEQYDLQKNLIHYLSIDTSNTACTSVPNRCLNGGT